MGNAECQLHSDNSATFDTRPRYQSAINRNCSNIKLPQCAVLRGDGRTKYVKDAKIVCVKPFENVCQNCTPFKQLLKANLGDNHVRLTKYPLRSLEDTHFCSLHINLQKIIRFSLKVKTKLINPYHRHFPYCYWFAIGNHFSKW